VLSTAKAAHVVKAAVEASAKLPVQVIIADTSSGNTVRGLVAYRSKKLIYAQCYRRETMRHLALSYGVYASFIEADETHGVFLRQAIKNLIEKKILTAKDMVVVVAGNFGVSGGTSFIEIGTIEELSKFVGVDAGKRNKLSN